MKAQILEDNLFVDSKIILKEGLEKALSQEKMIKFSDEEKRKTFIISYVVRYSLDNAIHFSNLELIYLYRKISFMFEVTFEEIFILNKKLRTNRSYELTEENIKLIACINFFIKIFFKKSSK